MATRCYRTLQTADKVRYFYALRDCVCASASAWRQTGAASSARPRRMPKTSSLSIPHSASVDSEVASPVISEVLNLLQEKIPDEKTQLAQSLQGQSCRLKQSCGVSKNGPISFHCHLTIASVQSAVLGLRCGRDHKLIRYIDMVMRDPTAWSAECGRN